MSIASPLKPLSVSTVQELLLDYLYQFNPDIQSFLVYSMSASEQVTQFQIDFYIRGYYLNQVVTYLDYLERWRHTESISKLIEAEGNKILKQLQEISDGRLS